MKSNNVPDNAYFDTDYNDSVVLSWTIDIATSDADKAKFKKDRFDSIAYKFVYDALTGNGYKRVGFNSGLLKDFADTTILDMYLNKDFDRLVKYYSLYFIKQ
jgi:hypothetical protein